MVKIGMEFQSSTFDLVQHSQFCDCMLHLLDKILWISFCPIPMHSTLVLPTWSIVVVSNLTVGVDGGIV